MKRWFRRTVLYRTPILDISSEALRNIQSSGKNILGTEGLDIEEDVDGFDDYGDETREEGDEEETGGEEKKEYEVNPRTLDQKEATDDDDHFVARSPFDENFPASKQIDDDEEFITRSPFDEDFPASEPSQRQPEGDLSDNIPPAAALTGAAGRRVYESEGGSTDADAVFAAERDEADRDDDNAMDPEILPGIEQRPGLQAYVDGSRELASKIYSGGSEAFSKGRQHAKQWASGLSSRIRDWQASNQRAAQQRNGRDDFSDFIDMYAI